MIALHFEVRKIPSYAYSSNNPFCRFGNFYDSKFTIPKNWSAFLNKNMKRFLSLQPMIPSPKRFHIFPPFLGDAEKV